MARVDIPKAKSKKNSNKKYTDKEIFGKRTGRKTTIMALSDKPKVNKVSYSGKILDFDPVKGTALNRYWRDSVIDIEKNANIKLYDKELAVNPKKLAETYGLVSVNFGNYVEEEQRVEMLFATAIALEQISKTFSIPRTHVGMNRLAIGLGSSGRPKSLATFQPANPVLININYITGGSYTGLVCGSFFHEYSHFIDYELGKYYHVPYLSGGSSTSKKIDSSYIDAGGVKSNLENIFSKLYWNDNKKTAFCDYIERMPEYWNRRTEVLSRTSEAWYTTKKLPKGKFNSIMSKSKSFYKNPAYPDVKLINKVDLLMNIYYKQAFILLNGKSKTAPKKRVLKKTNTKVAKTGLSDKPTFMQRLKRITQY